MYPGIRDARDLTDEIQEKLNTEIGKLKSRFNVQDESGLVSAAS